MRSGKSPKIFAVLVRRLPVRLACVWRTTPLAWGWLDGDGETCIPNLWPADAVIGQMEGSAQTIIQKPPSTCAALHSASISHRPLESHMRPQVPSGTFCKSKQQSVAEEGTWVVGADELLCEGHETRM